MGDRIHLVGPNGNARKASDAQGRVLAHNATVQDVHEIAAQRTMEVNEFYVTQIPPMVQQLVVALLIQHGLIKPVEAPPASEFPTPIATPDALAVEDADTDTPHADGGAG